MAAESELKDSIDNENPHSKLQNVIANDSDIISNENLSNQAKLNDKSITNNANKSVDIDSDIQNNDNFVTNVNNANSINHEDRKDNSNEEMSNSEDNQVVVEEVNTEAEKVNSVSQELVETEGNVEPAVKKTNGDEIVEKLETLSTVGKEDNQNDNDNNTDPINKRLENLETPPTSNDDVNENGKPKNAETIGQNSEDLETNESMDTVVSNDTIVFTRSGNNKSDDSEDQDISEHEVKKEEATECREDGVTEVNKEDATECKEDGVTEVKKEYTDDIENASAKTMKPPVRTEPVIALHNMLEDIEEGELDYDEEDGELGDEDLPDLPEYDPSALNNIKENVSDEGEIESGADGEREEGEIRDDDQTGQVYICVDPLNDRWKKCSKSEQKHLQDLEEGQIDEADEPQSPVVSPQPQQAPVANIPGRFIPRTLCKYFNNGLCRWGSTCRFLHPGVNDKGIPTDLQPTWNATAGNYVMHRPPGMYPNAFGKAPPPMDCINVPVLPAPIVDMSLLTGATLGHPEILALPVSMMGLHAADLTPRKETAWERGLRRAKEIKEAAARRRAEDKDFETKRLSMRIPEHVIDKDAEYEQDSENLLTSESNLAGWDIHDREKPSDYERRHERRSDRYSDRYSRTSNKDSNIDRSSGRARLAELPSSHPIRREERQRQREREQREKRDQEEKERHQREKEREQELETMYHKSTRPRLDKHEMVTPLSSNDTDMLRQQKTTGATEWHDPWMRTQPQPATQITPAATTKSLGVEAITDSDSSSSDSDSDSGSSSSAKSSGSDSDSGSSSSDHDSRKLPSDQSIRPELAGVSRKERHRQRSFEDRNKENATGKEKPEKNEPLSYEEWKRLQTLQKAKYHQQLANQYKNVLTTQDTVQDDTNKKKDRQNRDLDRLSKNKENEQTIRQTQAQNPRPQDPRSDPRSQDARSQDPRSMSSLKRPNTGTDYPARPELNSPVRAAAATNDDKFDSPKRKSDSDSDSNSGSDSDSDSDSASVSSDSDSEDSDSDGSISGAEMKTKLQIGNVPVKPVKTTAMDTAARKDIKLTLSDKPKVPDPSIAALTAAGAKRPARKDELLKELKAVEDAIARKRAKID